MDSPSLQTELVAARAALEACHERSEDWITLISAGGPYDRAELMKHLYELDQLQNRFNAAQRRFAH